MMSLTFGLFTQVSGSGPLGPLVYKNLQDPTSNHSRMSQLLLTSQGRASNGLTVT